MTHTHTHRVPRRSSLEIPQKSFRPDLQFESPSVKEQRAHRLQFQVKAEALSFAAPYRRGLESVYAQGSGSRFAQLQN